MTESQAGEFEQGDDLDVEQPARYQRTTNGLLGALIATVIVVGLFVGFREVFRDQPAIERNAVDYIGTVEAAQTAGVDLVYPASLPEGWIATSIDFVPGRRPAWGIGMLTDEGRFVGIRQEDADIDELLTAYVDKDVEPGDESTFDSDLKTGPWQTWADAGGDLAFSTTLTSGDNQTMGETLLVYGSAPRVDQEELIALLTEAGVK
ncbi:DUF4245 domain-containing protein [Nocardioides sp.]|uniref:DUF4245 domain-containing protein n=1 Tax=Nocardioides sp. TaxID=35761 RepID=UPI003565B6A8